MVYSQYNIIVRYYSQYVISYIITTYASFIDLMQHQYDIILLQIKVNGIDFHTFQHRIPMEQVRGLQIAGDVSIQMINFIGVSPQLRESSALMLRALLGKIN